MNNMKILKQIGLWVLTIFFAMSALVFLPSLASFFSILIAALILPLQKWQDWLCKYLKTGVKVILIIILFVLTISTAPSTTPADETDVPSSVNSENVHTHQFQPATCTTPKKCSICGITESVALGHTWNTATCTTPKTCSTCGITEGSTTEHAWANATCSAPKTCSICGTTTGNKTSHNYKNGKCATCGAKDPNYTSVEMVWIPTKGGTKYHNKSSCSQMDNPKQVTKSEAIAQGYEPCKRCYG